MGICIKRRTFLVPNLMNIHSLDSAQEKCEFILETNSPSQTDNPFLV